MAKMKTKKAVAIATAATLLVATISFLFGMRQVEEPSIEVDSGLVVEVSIKEDEVLISASTSMEERAVAYARNILIAIQDADGNVLNSNYITGDGDVVVDGNTAVYTEDVATLTIDNLSEGQVIVVVEALDHTAIVWFDSTTTSGGQTLNVVDIPSSALPAEERNVMDPAQGYHENVIDNEGNIVGNVTRTDIAGTVEEETNVESKAEIVNSDITGDRLYAETEVEPEATGSTSEIIEKVATDELSSVVTEETSSSEEISSTYAKVIILNDDGTVGLTLFGNGTEKLIVSDAEISITNIENGMAYASLGTFYC